LSRISYLFVMRGCHVCNSSELETVHAPARPIALVSSDVQTVNARVAWAVCPRCLTLQKILDRDWQRLADGIYARYDLNHQAAGGEPRLRDTAFGAGPRAEILFKYLLRLIDLPAAGRLLDIGCANGNLLRTFHPLRPGWELYGAEISDVCKDEVLRLPGVRGFHGGRDVAYPLRYDLITLCHVLEHVPDPAALLRPLVHNLAPDGRLLIVVPNIRQNPIDLLIADHCSHFDAGSLVNVVTAAGLEVKELTARTIPKELIAIVGAPAERPSIPWRSDEDEIPAADMCRDYFRLFRGVRDAARAAVAEASQFGIMGSSIAAAWLAREIDEAVDFFADEDESRWGRTLMGRPIVNLAEVAPGATVFIPMSTAVAKKIITRAGKSFVDFRYVDWNRGGATVVRREGVRRLSKSYA
jgi:2-polyprenyl-3-methyl-5-hydroxy-6-metoxy-1,4-benzoquinol methylase